MDAILKSRNFWLAVVGVLQSFLFYYIDVPQELWLSIDVLIGVLITAFTVEDAAKALREFSSEMRALRKSVKG